MNKIQLFDQPFFKPNKKNKLKRSGTISGTFNLIGTFNEFVIASSESDQSTYLIKLYEKIPSEEERKYTNLNKTIELFDNLSDFERLMVMDGYNTDGTVNKNLN